MGDAVAVSYLDKKTHETVYSRACFRVDKSSVQCQPSTPTPLSTFPVRPSRQYAVNISVHEIWENEMLVELLDGVGLIRRFAS